MRDVSTASAHHARGNQLKVESVKTQFIANSSLRHASISVDTNGAS